ncbi:MAG: PQQ-binding-like beta-propeller repeat protein, partial [Planctomycetota bacterium]
MNKRFPLALVVLVFLPTARAQAADWPQFRHDAGRAAASPHELPASLELLWARELPAPRPAFPHEVRLAYDASYEPVVVDRHMFVPSMVTDSVTALDTETGQERWRFFAEGPVRFAPVAWEGKVYFVSDDGYLYCLDANNG